MEHVYMTYLERRIARMTDHDRRAVDMRTGQIAYELKRCNAPLPDVRTRSGQQHVTQNGDNDGQQWATRNLAFWESGTEIPNGRGTGQLDVVRRLCGARKPKREGRRIEPCGPVQSPGRTSSPTDRRVPPSSDVH
jgi:hypothetical protein